MKLKLAVIVLALATTATDCHEPIESSAMPWLYGLGNARITETPTRSRGGSTEWLDAQCSGALSRLELVADVSPTPGDETVTVSLSSGVTVRDRDRRVVATAPGYDCEGSADEVTALAAGQAYLDPTVALAITRGGHREQTTELALFRVGTAGQLDPVFTAEVERRTGDRVRRGFVWLIPSGLIYQRPNGRPTLWTYDPVDRVYRPRTVEEPDQPRCAEPPCSEPPSIHINPDLQARR